MKKDESRDESGDESEDESENKGWTGGRMRITFLLLIILSVVVFFSIFSKSRSAELERNSLISFRNLETDLSKMLKEPDIPEAKQARIREVIKRVEEARKLLEKKEDSQ